MKHAGKGMAYHLLYLIVFLVASTAIYAYMSPQISGAKTKDVTNVMDTLKVTVFSNETCVNLDNVGNDREAGKTDVYTISADVKNAYAYALYFKAAVVGVPFTGNWNLESWKVSCNGKDWSGAPKTYNLIAWNYADVYAEGYLKVEAKALRSRVLIDSTKPLYDEVWGCPNTVTVTTVTSAKGWWGGTDDNVELCYYIKKKNA